VRDEDHPKRQPATTSMSQRQDQPDLAAHQLRLGKADLWQHKAKNSFDVLS
jgi:hypothetical protein